MVVNKKIAFTIATNDYLPFSITLGASLLEYNNDYRFIICLLDKKEITIDLQPFFDRFELIELRDIYIPNFSEMAKRYTPFELSCALKPFVAEYIIKTYSPEILSYFDSDIMVFNSFGEIDKYSGHNSFALTPHCLQPIERSDDNAMDLCILNRGLFNAGFFVAYPAHKDCKKILEWWKNKMFTECTTDLCNGRYVDQIWLNLLPIYFNDVAIIRNEGYNVAIWNLSERIIARHANDNFIINEKSSLIFFHFSGYDIKEHNILSKNHSNYTFENRKDVIPIFERYKTAVLGNEYEKFNPMVNSKTKKKERNVEKNKIKVLLQKLIGKAS